MPGVEIKIIDSDGKILPQGMVGELCTRSDMVMQGYYKNAKPADSIVDKDGWLYTGDLALQRGDGNYQIVGRMVETISINALNVYPAEIEQVLFTHPDIKDVAVVGVPDPLSGEKICAVIILMDEKKVSPESIIEFCKNKISPDKIPHYVIFVDELPMTIVGKIQKFKVKDFAARKLGLKTGLM